MVALFDVGLEAVESVRREFNAGRPGRLVGSDVRPRIERLDAGSVRRVYRGHRSLATAPRRRHWPGFCFAAGAVWATPYRCRSEVLRACTAELERSSATMRASACSRRRETG